MNPIVVVLGVIGLVTLPKVLRKSSDGASGAAHGDFGAEGMSGAHGILTPGRKDFFERAMRQKAHPEQFVATAELFDRAGLPFQAKLLRARAEGRKADKETHEGRRKVVRQAIASRDPFKIEQIAKIAEEQLGMTDTAEKLREVAKGLREAAVLPRTPNAGEDEERSGEPGVTEPVYPEPYVAGPNMNPVVGDGGNLASVTQMAGECLVHGTSGGCMVGSADKVTPPEDEEIAKLESAKW